MSGKQERYVCLLLAMLFVTTTGAPSPNATVVAEAAESNLDFYRNAIYECGGNDPLDMLFPPSDLTNHLIENVTKASNVQKESMTTFCHQRHAYSKCVVNRLSNPKTMTDTFLSGFINIETFDRALDLYCNNSAEINENFNCTQNAVTENNCMSSGIVGLLNILNNFFSGQTHNLETVCSLMQQVTQCRVHCQLKPCGNEYASIMMDVYSDLLSKEYCPLSMGTTFTCPSQKQ